MNPFLMGAIRASSAAIKKDCRHCGGTGAEPMKLVLQEHPEGCLIACLAMVSGKTYREVDAMFVRDRYEDGGLNDYQVFDFLATEGFSWRHLHRHTLLGTEKVRQEWPPVITSLAIARVNGGRGGSLSHGIVVTPEGVAYDPAQGVRRFSDYDTIGSVTLIYAAPPTLSAELARVTELLKAAERERDAAVGRAEQAERLHSELNSREMARRAQAMRGGT
jgi:hypothetical protein